MKKIILILLFISTQSFALKIGYINPDLLLSQSTQFKESQVQIQQEFKKRYTELGKKSSKLETMIANFKKTQSDLTKEEEKEQFLKIKQLEISLKKSDIKLKKLFDLRSKEELQNIQDKINDTIGKFAKKHKYDMIFYQEVAFVTDKLDISKSILQELEKNRSKESKK